MPATKKATAKRPTAKAAAKKSATKRSTAKNSAKRAAPAKSAAKNRTSATHMKPSAQIKNTLVKFYDQFSRGDAAALMDLMSGARGVLTIGTDPQEWWDERNKMRHAFEAQLKELGGARLVAGAPKGYEEGSVGWASDRPIIRMPDGTEIPTRVTAVLHREGGGWKLVQTHISLGVANEEVVGQTLTI
ncbi:MAG: nuclear transport factor 2 family protein [Chloroflexota bacterium]|nr:nuclear transport factor 2 family protein [Chloroflexota bacterium]